MKKILIFVLLISYLSVFSQSRSELRIQQKRIEGRISYLSHLVNQKTKDVSQNLNSLTILEHQIKTQELLIKNLKLQNTKTVEQIQFHIDEKDRLEARFNTLKEEYANVLMSYAKTRNAYNDWMFILAAENFNSIYKRFVYLNQYADYRKSQAREIKETAASIELVIDSIQLEKFEQERLLNLENAHLASMDSLKSERLVMIEAIKKKQLELKQKLAVAEAKEKTVKSEVLKYIANERTVRENREKIIDATASKNKSELLNRVFESSMGKLNWPVASGVIVKRFGVYHPANMRQITLRSDGIDIQTSLAADVKSVFKGKVVKIVNVPGFTKAVLVQHGDYYVLYSNLKYLKVKIGDTISKGQLLGKVYGESSEDNTAIIKFQIWKNQDKLNPEKWLRTGMTY